VTSSREGGNGDVSAKASAAPADSAGERVWVSHICGLVCVKTGSTTSGLPTRVWVSHMAWVGVCVGGGEGA
jgi:hypothetical protein